MADQSNEPVIEIEGLDFAYPGGRTVFKNLSLKFDEGRFYLIRGASGAGKSTLLRLLIRLEEADRGDIRFKGRRLVDFPPERLRREILYVQQTPTVTTGTVRGNLLLPFRFRANGDLTPPDDQKLSERLQKFLLNDVGLRTDAKSLSVGQLQRLCLIRGLLLAPRVVLLDEPASALDETSRRVVEETAERLCTKDGLTVLMVSHRQFKPVSVKPVTLRISQASLERIE
jgi:putative ABC transport system ATP-binding protein